VKEGWSEHASTKAVREKYLVKALIVRIAERRLTFRPNKKRNRVVVPLIRSKRIGSLDLDNHKIYNFISFP
jgi:hypothetical protein